MATRTFLSIIYLLYLVNFTVAFSLQHVMARLNSLEVKFDMENKLRRSETEELFRRVSEISTGGKAITASEHVSRDAPSDYGEPMSPKERVVPLDRITILPYTDKNKTTESALELYKLKSHLIEGAKVEKDKNLKLRIELKGIGNMLKTDYAMLNSNINEGIRNLTNHLTENRKLLEIDFAIFKSNIEAEILNLTKYLSENKHSVETDYASFKSNIREGIKHLKDGISENQKSQVSVERFDNFTDLVTTALSIASTESRQAITLLKSEFEMSMNKISNNASTVNNRQTEIEISMQKLSNDFSLVNKTLSSITDIQYELKYSIQELVFYANTKNRRSCRHSPDNGVYDIYPGEKSVSSIRVYCDQTTDGGRWIVFQRRQDGSVDFERTWADYKTGFGNLEGEFWIGNDNLHALTSAGFNELRIDLEDFEGNRAYAKYRNFKVKSESEKYELEVSGYSGDAGDSLTSWHNGMSFSTKDRDNDKRDGNCAIQFKGAWWYNSCHQANLNGYYFRVAVSPVGEGINWFHWKGWLYSLKRVDMKIR